MKNGWHVLTQRDFCFCFYFFCFFVLQILEITFEFMYEHNQFIHISRKSDTMVKNHLQGVRM